jgi:hypothetical protein
MRHGQVRRRSISVLLVVTLVAVALPAKLMARRDPTEYVDLDCMFGDGWNCWSGAQKALVVGGLAGLTVGVVYLLVRGRQKPPTSPSISIEHRTETEYHPWRPLPEWVTRSTGSLTAASTAREQLSERPEPSPSNNRRGSRIARVVTGIAMVGGGAALAKWGYDRPQEMRTYDVCTGPSFAPTIAGVPGGLQQQINNLGSRCEQRSEEVGRTGGALGTMLAGIGLITIGTTVAVVP